MTQNQPSPEFKPKVIAFPGQSKPRPMLDLPEGLVGWKLLLVACLIALVAGLPMLIMPPIDRDEARFAQATSQMLETGDYVSINYQDTPRHKKPVGIYWAQAAAVAITSAVEDRDIFAYRLPSLLGAMLTALATTWLGMGILSRRGALTAGALIAGSLLLSTEAGIAKTDALLCGTTTLAMAGFGRAYLRHMANQSARWRDALALWIGLGLSLLIKGPIGPMVLGLCLVLLGIWGKDWRFLKALKLRWGLVILVLICAPWAAAITIKTDGAFWTHAIVGDLAPKLKGGQEGHAAMAGYHSLLLLLLIFPAGLLLPAAIKTALTESQKPEVRFLIAWFIPAFIVFELSPTKLPHYPLPTYPALMLLCALALDGKSLQTLKDSLKVRWLGAGLNAFVACVLAAAILYGQYSYGAPGTWPLAAMTSIAFLVAGLGAGYLLVRGAAGLATALALAAGIVAHSGLVLVVAQLPHFFLSPQADQLIANSGFDPRDGKTQGPVAAVGYAEPSLVFLLGTSTQLCDTPEEGVEALAQGRPVLVESREEDHFLTVARTQGLGFKALGEISGRNYSKGQDAKLTLFIRTKS